MNNYFTLTKALLKNSFGFENKKRKSIYLVYLLLIVAMIPTLFMVYYSFNLAFETLPSNQSGSVLAAGIQMSALLVLVFSIFVVPSVYYMSNDIKTLLTLPLSPQTILASKFTINYIFEFTFSLGSLLPLFIAYATNNGISPTFIVLAIVSILTIPIFSLVYSSIIIMVIMRFTPFIKNRDTFNMIAGILGIFLAFGLSYAMQSLNTNNVESLMEMLFSENGLIPMFGKIFPSIPFLVTSFTNNNIVDVIIYIAFLIAYLAIFLLLANQLYFKGAIGFGESSSSNKVVSEKQKQTGFHEKNILLSYVKKELLILFRTPVYFINCILSSLLIPILFAGAIAFSGELEDLGVLRNAITQILVDAPDFTFYVILAAFGFGFFMSSMNSISSTAISREGLNFGFMKYTPIPVTIQIYAKILPGIILSLISISIIVVAIALFLQLSLWYLILFFLVSILPTIVSNLVAIMIDLSHPKLIWEQEVQPIKQNLVAMIPVLLGIAAGSLSIGAMFLSAEAIPIVSILLIALCILLTIIFFLTIKTFAQKRLNKLYV